MRGVKFDTLSVQIVSEAPRIDIKAFSAHFSEVPSET